LKHVLERAVLLCRGDAIVAADLGLEAPSRLANHAPGATAGVATLNLEQNERELIRRALESSAGNVVEAARLLGLSRSGLYRRLQRYGLS